VPAIEVFEICHKNAACVFTGTQYVPWPVVPTLALIRTFTASLKGKIMLFSCLKHGRVILAATLVLFAAACTDSLVTPTTGPLSLNVVSGDGQSALANTELPDPLVVQVLDAKGHPVREQIVNFRVVSGGGSVYAGTSLTNSDGIAKEWWTLGASGTQRVEVRAVDPTTGEKQLFATFNATITPPPPPLITPDAYEPNEVQPAARLIANMGNGESRSLSANFHTLIDVDWFRFRVLDGSNPGCTNPFSPSEDFTFTTTLTNVPVGSTYTVSLYDGATLRGSRTVPGGSSGSFTYSYSGSCGPDNSTNLDLKVERVTGDPSATMYSLSVSVTEE
jgi:hypothetical protein